MKPKGKENIIRQKVLAGLIEMGKSHWDRKSFAKDSDKDPEIEKMPTEFLKLPLARNVSDLNVNRYGGFA